MARSKKQTSVEKDFSVKINVITTEDTPYYYVNFAEIRQSQHEFILLGVRVPTSSAESIITDKDGISSIITEASFQMIIPPTVMPGLIEALKSQLEKYEERMGKLQSEKSGE